MKKILLISLFSMLVFNVFSQTGKIFFYGETQCAFVIENNIIYESGSTACTPRIPLYDIKDNKVYYHNSNNECAIVLIDDKIYFSSRNSNEIDRLMWIVKDNELVYPNRQSEPAYVIEENKIFFGANNAVKRKDRQILTIEGDVPKVALYMILYLIAQ